MSNDIGSETTRPTHPIDIIDEILTPLLGSMQATSPALTIWHALRKAGLLNEEILPEVELENGE